MNTRIDCEYRKVKPQLGFGVEFECVVFNSDVKPKVGDQVLNLRGEIDVVTNVSNQFDREGFIYTEKLPPFISFLFLPVIATTHDELSDDQLNKLRNGGRVFWDDGNLKIEN